ncbi:MAG: AI-2E family transporter [Lactobacillales bacterium]|jgi:predicted PurR-regulated permease PerM|nr:AI-2E family transporter [Lactobacillales bacterium]
MEQEKSKGIVFVDAINHRVIRLLVSVLLVLVCLYVASKLHYIWSPIGQFLAVVSAPIITAGIFYYLMNPLVDILEKKKIPRTVTIITLFVLAIAVIIWAVVAVVPFVELQLIEFATNFPHYWTSIQKNLMHHLPKDVLKQFGSQISSISEKSMDSISKLFTTLGGQTWKSVHSVLSVLTIVVLTVITFPFILFFLLKDGKNITPYITGFLPRRYKRPTAKVMGKISDRISAYVRGQLIVAFSVGVLFIVGYQIIGLKFGVALGVIAGILNLIPYLGSFIAIVLAIFVALVVNPIMVIKVLIVFFVEQTVEGRLISPMVLGNSLEIHPVTILLVLLSAGKLFGVVGVIIGIPVYAAIKVIVIEIYEWYKRVSVLYEADREHAKREKEKSAK